MIQRKLLVDCVQVEHRLYRSSRKRQSLENGSYTVTASLRNARFNGYYVTLELLKQQDFKKPFTKT